MFNLSRLEDTAKEQGVTKTHLCSLVGRPKYYINDIKNKGLSVPESYIETWAKALHTTPEYLKGETDVKEKPPVGNEGNDEVERQLLEKMRSGKNQMFIIGHGAPIKMVELTDEEAAVMDATLQAMRAAKAKEEGKKE